MCPQMSGNHLPALDELIMTSKMIISKKIQIIIMIIKLYNVEFSTKFK
jgi:hypothetical protein